MTENELMAIEELEQRIAPWGGGGETPNLGEFGCL